MLMGLSFYLNKYSMRKPYLIIVILFFGEKSFSQTSYTLNWAASFSPSWASNDISGTATNIGGSGINATVNMVSSGGAGTFVGSYPRVDGVGDIVVSGSTNAVQVNMDFNSNTEVMTTTFTFSQPVSGVKMGIADIDKNSSITNNYLDSVSISGTYGTLTILPTITKVNPSNWTLVNTNHAYANTANGQGGNASSTTNTTTSQACSILIDFGKKAITSFTITYTNSVGAQTNPDMQDIAFGNISFNKTISASGTIWNDINGSAAGGFSGIQNGTETGTDADGGLYATLVNTIGSSVAASMPVNADGTYSFSGLVQSTSVSVRLSTIIGVPGSVPPSSGLPSGWEPTSPLSQSFSTGISGNNISSKDFGIERPPVTPDLVYDISQPAYLSFQTLNGTGASSSPGPLASSDPDDGPIGSGNTFSIVNLSGLNGNKLFYNNVEITGPVIITNYNPSLLAVQYTGASSTDLSFTFSTTDAAGKESNLATYSINWAEILPLHSLSVSAVLQGNIVQVKWKTENEINTSRFFVERSIDNRSFETIGETAAAGNFPGIKNYSLVNDISAVNNVGIIYYRIKLKDIDGKIKYSTTVAVRLTKPNSIKIWPNPVSDFVSISLFSETNTNIGVNIFNAVGKKVTAAVYTIVKGNNQINVSNFSNLANGLYLLQIKDDAGKIEFIQKLIKK
jgi:hypothetical protein